MLQKSLRRMVMQVLRSLAARVLLILSLVFAALFVLYNGVYSSMQEQFLERSIQLSAIRCGDLVRKSTFRSMLKNDRETLFETIKMIADEPGIERIRIYNKGGEIMFSTQHGEVNTIVDMENPACISCHSHPNTIKDIPAEKRFRVFEDEEKASRLIGLIVPIYNQRSCWESSCHFHEKERNILGVLDVQFSLVEFDTVLKEARSTTTSYSLALIVFGLCLVGTVVYVAAFRPIKKLREGTHRLSEGDMSYRIELRRHDELGQLATSFNSMASNLEQAYNDLKNWSHTLEEKVENKTHELRRIHKEIVKVERLNTLGKMAATVAHELNNPLSGILNYSRLLQKKLRRLMPEDEERKKLLENLELIASESMRCGTIVKNLLVFARGSDIRSRPSDLVKIIEKALQLMKHHFELGGVQTRLAVETQERQILCDPDQLMQALVALLVNAVEAMPDGGTINIHLADGDGKDHLALSIADNGVGIAEEVRDKIFEPFFSKKSGKKGAGLGLSVVYGIVQRHRGSIRVQSEVGNGTTFIIELPKGSKEENHENA